ncbi:hypothetical protein HD599_002282 [Conyzicola lurida]|uniref:Uncharacterized protein n=1 Tax=Conyzicola lurida TaxID=1172621 RepID=A0A841ARB3_9MICO|nr:hypothetical protein [Conyzicola lurida]MBB5843959.1 hypothetical protein [Conyzicola lurida]
MDVGGLTILATTGGVGVALAILIALGFGAWRRRVDTTPTQDAESAAALRGIQADIEKGQRGF